MTVREQLESLAAHNAYHFGRIVLLRQLRQAWPPPSGGSAGNIACSRYQKNYNGGVGGLEGSHVLAPVTLTGRRKSLPSSVM